MKQIYILDDDAGFRETASLWLDSLEWTVTAFDDPRTFLQAIGPKTANGFALMLDVRMPFMSGLQVIRKLNELGIKLPVIFVTGHGDVQLAVEAMREGAITFLEKPLDAFALESALDLVEGALKSDAKGAASDPVAERVARLTDREREVFDHMVAGKMNKVIAGDLSISIKTVELHRKRVMEKMEAKNYPHFLRMVLSGAPAYEGG